MVAEGVDYAFSVPTIPSLLSANKEFVVRYGGPGTSDKWLTASELKRLTDVGIWVVANAEGTADGFNSYNAGVSWATSAEKWFRGLGMPGDRPIYFSVDSGGLNGSQIDAACDGAASVIGRNRVGVYGGYSTIDRLYKNGKAKWFWQTFAWSGGRWHPQNHIEQYRNGVTIGGGDCDLDRALKNDYGQWGVDMTTVDLSNTALDAVAARVWQYQLEDPANVPNTKPAGAYLRYRDVVEVDQAQRVIDTLSPLVSTTVSNLLMTMPPALVAALGDQSMSIDQVVAVLKAIYGPRLPEIVAALQK